MRGRVLGDGGEPRRGAGVLDRVEQEVQEDEVLVLDLVGAVADELLRGHEGGDVPRHAHAVLVGGAREDRHQLRFDGAVDLELDVAVTGVGLHRGLRLPGGVHLVLDRRAVRAGAVDDAGQDHPGPDGGTVVEALLHGEQRVHLVAHVAHRGDAVGDVEEAVGPAQVDVHVPQPGQDGLAVEGDHLGAVGHGGLAVGADGGDAVALDHHRAVGEEDGVLGVEERGPGEDEGAGGAVAKARGERGRAIRFGGVLGREQRGDGVLPPLGNGGEPVADRGEEAAVGVEPHPDRREVEACDGDLRDRAVLAAGGDLGLADLLEGGLALRQQREGVARGAEQRGGQQTRVEGRGVEGKVERRAGNGAAARVPGGLPRRPAAGALERLRDGRLHVVVAAGLDADGSPVGTEGDGRVEARPPAAVRVLEVHAVGGGPRLLHRQRAGVGAAEDHGEDRRGWRRGGLRGAGRGGPGEGEHGGERDDPREGPDGGAHAVPQMSPRTRWKLPPRIFSTAGIR